MILRLFGLLHENSKMSPTQILELQGNMMRWSKVCKKWEGYILNIFPSRQSF